MQLSEILNWVGSLLGMTVFLQGVVPPEYRDYVADLADRVIQFISPYVYFVIVEVDGMKANEIYEAVQTYLSIITSQRARISHISRLKNAKKMTFSLANKERILDSFNGIKVEWLHKIQERKNDIWLDWDSNSDTIRSFQMKLPRAHKDFLLDAYFAYITEKAKEIQRGNRDLHLYSNRRIDRSRRQGGWDYIPFRHPASFDSIAMDPEVKQFILQDLDDFVKGEEFYRRVGKAWKRGYLLFGPPGTGKTTVVAAMANKLRYDIYDLELTEVHSNADLRNLLSQTAGKSIIVIEDIDCSLDLSGQRKKTNKPKKDTNKVPPHLRPDENENDASKVTLSGLLNFIDGLWSSCESERIFIFTTNFVDKLDPALLRAGRMDVHIELSYCAFPAFKALAKNFLDISDHPRFPEVELLIDSSFISPADVGEVLTKHRRDPDAAVGTLIEDLHDRKSKGPPKRPHLSDQEDDDDDNDNDDNDDDGDNDDNGDNDDDSKSNKIKKDKQEPTVKKDKEETIVKKDKEEMIVKEDKEETTVSES